MIITRKSFISGIERTMDLDVTPEALKRWKEEGIAIQKVFPDLTPEEREFLKTGITKEEWETIPED